MASFGEALNDFGLFGFSEYNPQALMNNCVFVTFAYLKVTTVDQLYAEISQKFQVDDSKGLSLEKIFDIITMVADSGTERYTKNGKGLKGVYTDKGFQTNATSKSTRILLVGLPKSGVQAVGVVYLRPEPQPGHCVTVKKTVPDALHPDGLQYMRYQHYTEGVDVTEEVKRSRSVLVFSITQHRIRHLVDPQYGY